MKKILLLLSLFVILISSPSCRRIDAGHTGIKFNYYGVTEEKGISDRELVSGMVFFNPFTRGVYEFPHFWQDVEYEDVSFNSLEGEPIESSLKSVYRFRKESIPQLFDLYRESPKDLKYGIIESIILEELSAQAGKMSAVGIMGQQREELLSNVVSGLNEKYGELIEFDLVTFTSDLKPSKNVKEAVQGVIQAQEKAKSAQAKTVEIEEEAKQIIITARADSSSQVIRAAGKAKEVELIQRQLENSPRYIDFIKATKWDGVLPQVTGGVTPFMEIK